MTEEHQTIRRLYAAFGQRDIDAVAVELHDEAEVDFAESLGPESGVYPGIEGIRKLLELYWDAFEEISIEPEDFIDGANGIVALVVARGTGRGSGVAVEARGPHLWAFRDGKVVRFTLFQERGDALEAAGLSKTSRS